MTWENMSELREELDKNGIAWSGDYDDNGDTTTWKSPRGQFFSCGHERFNHNLYLHVSPVTAKQAIAVTTDTLANFGCVKVDDELEIDTKGCESLLWEMVGALDVADAADAKKKPIVAEYARLIVATLGSDREKALEELIHDLIPFVCADDDIEGIEMRMRVLGLME